MSKCIGCGVRLQYEDKNKIGYAPKKDAKYCMRCFKLANYHENIKNNNVIKDEDILNKINKKNIFTFFLIDILNINNKVINLYNKITNPKVLVLTKVDILPKNLKLSILIDNIKKAYKIKDVLLFSKENGLGKNDILNLCAKHSEIIFAGPTSSGKSSLINNLFSKNLTVSEYQNTTMDFITIFLDNMKIIDAPGFNQMYPVKENVLKKIINPKTITISKDYALFIGDNVLKGIEDLALSLYFPENIKIKTKKNNSEYKKISIPAKSDFVIPSIGFIYFKNKATIMSNIKDYEIRESVVSYHE